MDLWAYMLQKEREFARFSVVPEPEPGEMFLAAEDSPDGERGRVSGRLHFAGHDAHLEIYERLVVRGSVPHRVVYSYSLTVGGVHEHGWACEPDHNPGIHEHDGTASSRRPGERVTLAAVLETCWQRLSEQAEGSRSHERDGSDEEESA